jgi:fructokinase
MTVISKTKNTQIIMCYGEVLYDIHGEHSSIGGAPFNVAYDLGLHGVRVYLISAIGNDALGVKILQYMKDCKLDCVFINKNQLPTGRAFVNYSDDGPHFEIDCESAWDSITLTHEQFSLLKDIAPPLLYYGTLAARSETSFSTLKKVMDASPSALRFCDLNLRKPFYNKKRVVWAMEEADVLRINKSELLELSKLLQTTKRDDNELMVQISKDFEIPLICVTLGGAGAIAYAGGNLYHAHSSSLGARNTVGAGDAFSAGLIKGIIEHKSTSEALMIANEFAFNAIQRKNKLD